MPPPTEMRSDEKSRSVKPLVFMSPLNSVFTPVIAVTGTPLSVLTNPGMSRGLVIRTLMAPNRMYVRQFTVSAKMW